MVAAQTSQDAEAHCDRQRPDLIIAETNWVPNLDLNSVNGSKSIQRYAHSLRFLTTDTRVESKVRSMQLDVDDYVIRPIYTQELILRVQIILDKHAQMSASANNVSASLVIWEAWVWWTCFAACSKDAKVQHFTSLAKAKEAPRFRDGVVIDANTGRLTGEEAVYRLLRWETGSFEIDFSVPQRPVAVTSTTAELLMEGLKRIDEWTRIAEQLPPLNTVFSVDYGVLADHLADLPDTVNSLLRLFDGRRTANEVVAESEHPDLATLDTLSQLYFEGIIAVSRPTESDGSNQTVPDYKTSVPPAAVPTLADALIQTASAMSQQTIEAEEAKPTQTPPPPQTSSPEQKPKAPILSPPPAEAFTQAPSVNDTQASDAQDDSSHPNSDPSIWDLKSSVTAQDAKSINTQQPETMTVMPDEDERFPEFEEAEESGGMASIDDDFFGSASYGVSNEPSFYEEPANDNEDIAPTRGPKIALLWLD